MTHKQKIVFFFSLLFVLYFLTRLINLTLLPIFNDESTYIRYGMHQLHEVDHAPYSLLIGKEPLMPFLYAVVGSLIGNYLLGARLVTVVVGALTLLGLCLFIKQVRGNRAALVTGILYVFAPYTLFFDRLALMDSAVSAIAIWSLYCTYQFFEHPRWRYAIGLGITAGLGLWTKTSALFYVLLPVVSCVLYYIFARGSEEKKIALFKYIGAALGITAVIFLPLFANEKYAVHMQLLQQYTYPFFSMFTFPTDVWWRNLSDIAAWLFFYLTPPLFLFGLATLGYYWKQKKLQLVNLWFWLPLFYEVLFAKLFTSRHALLLVVPLLIAAGYGWSQFYKKRQLFAYMFLAFVLVWASYYNLTLLIEPQTYPSRFAGPAKSDLEAYVFGFSSGYGVQEAIDFLKEQADKQPIAVVIRNDHGNPEDAIVAYLDYQPNILLIALNQPTEEMKNVFAQVDKSMPIYFVSRGAYYGGLEKYFVAQKQFSKPNDKEFVGVELLSQMSR